MARNTRQRRRQRRRAQDGEQQQSVSQRARSRQQAVRPAAQVPKTQTGSRRVPGGGFRRFVGESIAELKKVVRPTRSELVTYTTVVVVFVLIVMAFVSVLDYGIGRLTLWVFGD